MRLVPRKAEDPRYSREDAVRGASVEIWISDRYECTVLDLRKDGTRLRHLSVNRLDRRPLRDWRHLQQIKNEVCGELWTGVEFFPPEDRLVDAANQYHLYCFPPDVDFGCLIGQPGEGLVSDDEQVHRWNAADHPGRQEPWEPGLTTGRTELSARARHCLGQQAEADDAATRP